MSKIKESKKTGVSAKENKLFPNIPNNRRIICPDITAIRYDPKLLYAFDNVSFFITSGTLNELSKESKNEFVEEFFSDFNEIVGDKDSSVPIFFKNGRNSIQVYSSNGDLGENEKAEHFFDDSPKNNILNACMTLTKRGYKNVFLYTTNNALKAKAGFLKIKLNKSHEIKNQKFSYIAELFLNPKNHPPIEKLEQEDAFPIKYVKELKEGFIHDNYYYISRGNEKFFYLKYNSTKKLFIKVFPPTECFGIKPRNVDQSFLLAALADQEIDIIAITGSTGSGKTLLSLCMAMELCSDKDAKTQFQKIFLSKPIVEVGAEVGFLPGNLDEKIEPHMCNFFDNISTIEESIGKIDDSKLKNILKTKFDSLINKNSANKIGTKIIITPIQTLRGRTISLTVYIIDECQNLTPHEIKTILSRAGEHTRVFMCGDTTQVDVKKDLDKYNNGLSHLIKNLYGKQHFKHIHLPKTVRSRLAKMADKYL